MSARNQSQLTPSSVPNLTLLRWLEKIRDDVDQMMEERARDGLPYPLRWKATKTSEAPSFTIQLYNPITGELCSICDTGSSSGICECELPPGGVTGEALVKFSDADGDVGWAAPDLDQTLDDLTDVDVSGATDLAVLQLSSGVWVPAFLFLTDLVDVNASLPDHHDVLKFDAGSSVWVATDLGVLDDLGDVDTTGVSDGDVLTMDSGDWVAAAPANGLVDDAESTGAQGGITTVTDVTSLTVVVNAVAGRSYELFGMVNVLQNTAPGIVNATLADSSNTVLHQPGISLGTGEYGLIILHKVISPGTGTFTYKVRLQTSAGTVSLNQGASSPNFLVARG